MEIIWWPIEGALGDDVICRLLLCSAVAGWTLGYKPHLHISIESPDSSAEPIDFQPGLSWKVRSWAAPER